MAPHARTRCRLGEQTGFGVIELLVATSMSLILFLAASNFWEIASDNQTDTGNRVEALGQQRVGLEQMTRELRGARRVDVSTPGVIDFDVYQPSNVGGGQVQYGWRRIVYDCAEGAQCRRYEGPVGGTLDSGFDPLVCVGSTTPDPTPGELSSLYDPAECEVDTAAFTLDPADQYLEIELWVAVPERDYPIALSDGVFLRNRVRGI